MSTPHIVLLLLALADLALGGLISNGFIVTVILREWTKSRSLASSEQLLLSLGLSNFFAIASVTPLFINDYIIQIFSNCRFLIMYPLSDCLILCRFWLTAWLCVFYCIKIVNSTHSLFLWCKLRISWLLPRLIAGSFVASLIFVFFIFYFVFSKFQSSTAMNGTTCREALLNRTVDIPEVLFLIVGSGCPLLVVLVCSFLVVASLCRHVCRMKDKECHSRNLDTKAHVKAAGTVLFLLFLHLSFYLAQTLSMTVTVGKMEGIVFALVVMMYPPAQAYILLLVNPKLNQAATQRLSRRDT